MAAPDALSRLHENKEVATSEEIEAALEKQKLKLERGEKIREGRAKEHTSEINGKK